MNLRRLSLKNVGPFRGEHTLTLSPTDPESARPITLIGALNGSGKTTLLDSLLLVLYGARARCSTRDALNYPEFLARLRNRGAAAPEEAHIDLEFDYPNEQGSSVWRVVRQWRAGAGWANDAVSVFVDGLPNAECTETWAERVEDFVPLGVSNLFFFDGEQVRALATSNETIPEVRSAIRTLLGLELADRLRQDLRIVATRKRREAMSMPDLRPLDELQRLVDEHEAQAKILVTEVERATAKLLRAREELERARQAYISGGGALAEGAEETRNELDRVRADIADERRALSELAAGLLPLQLLIEPLSTLLTAARRELNVHDTPSVVLVLAKRDAELIQQLRRFKAPKAIIDDATEWLAQDRARRSTSGPSQSINWTERDLNAVDHLAMVQLPIDRAQAARRFGRIQSLLVEEARLIARQQAAAPPETAAMLSHTLQQARVITEEAEDELLRQQRRLDEANSASRRTREALERKLREATAELDEAQTRQRVLRAADRVDEVLDRYEKALKRHRIQTLEELVTERLRFLLRKRDLIDHVEIEPETFGLVLRGPNGQSIDRARLSAGEQQILAISLLWGLSMASGRRLPVVIDTPLSRLDSEHRRRLLDGYFPQASHQVILLSTDAEINNTEAKHMVERGVVNRTFTLDYEPEHASSHIREGYFGGAQ